MWRHPTESLLTTELFVPKKNKRQDLHLTQCVQKGIKYWVGLRISKEKICIYLKRL